MSTSIRFSDCTEVLVALADILADLACVRRILSRITDLSVLQDVTREIHRVEGHAEELDDFAMDRQEVLLRQLGRTA